MTTQEQAIKELAIRQLEKRHADKRESLLEFVKYYRQVERKINLDMNRHIELICEKLEAVARGEIKRLMINIPPRALKTELVSIAFPAWCLGNQGNTKFMGISYSSGLSQDNSSACRAMYQSDTYKTIFPRVSPITEDQNTKQYRTTKDGGQYYASGSSGTITGKGCDIMVIDDPLKPDEADSDISRTAVNNNYKDTLESRLDNPGEGAIVIIMQRLHDDDLCGHLLDQEEHGYGDKREKIIVPAIAVEDDQYRKVGESFFPKRFPLTILDKLRATKKQAFSTQYQQEPVDESTQEFHLERFRYHGEDTGNKTPSNLRIFTAVDPAFKQNQHNDNSSIITAGFVNDTMYILEYTQGKFTPDVLLEKIIYHIQKRGPEKTGIEAFQAQSMILTFLKNELNKRGIHTVLEEIRQTGDKETKIRRLVPLYKNGLIYHKRGMDALEHELLRFPRGKHDDIIDSEQMLYDMYTLHPNTVDKVDFRIEYDNFGRPIIV